MYIYFQNKRNLEVNEDKKTSPSKSSEAHQLYNDNTFKKCRDRSRSRSRSKSKSNDGFGGRNSYRRSSRKDPINILQEFISSLNYLLSNSSKIPNILEQLSKMQQILISSVQLIQQQQQLIMQTNNLNQSQYQLSTSLSAFQEQQGFVMAQPYTQGNLGYFQSPGAFINSIPILNQSLPKKQSDYVLYAKSNHQKETKQIQNTPMSMTMETSSTMNNNNKQNCQTENVPPINKQQTSNVQLQILSQSQQANNQQANNTQTDTPTPKVLENLIQIEKLFNDKIQRNDQKSQQLPETGLNTQIKRQSKVEQVQNEQNQQEIQQNTKLKGSEQITTQTKPSNQEYIPSSINENQLVVGQLEGIKKSANMNQNLSKLSDLKLPYLNTQNLQNKEDKGSFNNQQSNHNKQQLDTNVIVIDDAFKEDIQQVQDKFKEPYLFGKQNTNLRQQNTHQKNNNFPLKSLISTNINQEKINNFHRDFVVNQEKINMKEQQITSKQEQITSHDNNPLKYQVSGQQTQKIQSHYQANVLQQPSALIQSQLLKQEQPSKQFNIQQQNVFQQQQANTENQIQKQLPQKVQKFPPASKVTKEISVYDRACLLIGMPLDYRNQDIIEELKIIGIQAPEKIESLCEKGLDYMRFIFKNQVDPEELLLKQPPIKEIPILYLPYMEDCKPMQMLLNHQLRVDVQPRSVDQIELYGILMKYGKVIEIFRENEGQFIVLFVNQELPARLTDQNLIHPSTEREVKMNFYSLQQSRPIKRKIYSSTIHALYQKKCKDNPQVSCSFKNQNIGNNQQALELNKQQQSAGNISTTMKIDSAQIWEDQSQHKDTGESYPINNFRFDIDQQIDLRNSNSSQFEKRFKKRINLRDDKQIF